MENINPLQQDPGGMPPQVPQVNPQSSPIGQEPMNPQTTSGGGQVVSPETKQELLDIMEKVKGQLEHVQAVQFASEQKTEQLRQDLLKKAFEQLKEAGVDLTDQQSVAAFIANLREQNPEMAASFEEAMAALLGGEGMPAEETQMGEMPAEGMPMNGMPATDVNMNNENTNETLPKDPPGYM